MTHEEADIIMAYNMIEVSVGEHSSIRVVSDDTDVLIIIMHQLQTRAYNLPATVKVTIEASSGRKSSDYHKDKTSLHQLYLVSCNCNKCHNAHAASMISLALRSVNAWVEQHGVKHGVKRSVSPERMDNDDTQPTSADCTTTDLTVELPPVEAKVCAVNKEKTTKKARRKANKDQADAVWKVCVPNCFHNGNNNKGNVVQCHLCQTWIHPECVGQNDSDIVGIWTCPTCRTLPVLVEQLLIVRAGVEACSPRGIQQATRCPRGRATKGDERTS